MSKEVDIKELLKLLKAQIEDNKESREELKELRKELKELKSRPDFQSAPYSRSGDNLKVQKSLIKKVDEILLLEEEDRPEYLSKKYEREELRREGVEKMGIITAKLLKYAHDKGIILRYVKDDDD